MDQGLLTSESYFMIYLIIKVLSKNVIIAKFIFLKELPNVFMKKSVGNLQGKQR